MRPYEVNLGETDRVVTEITEAVAQVLEKDGDLPGCIRESMAKMAAIPVTGARKPLVGVVGEIYVRNNVYAKEDVISAIELFGGEAWMIPITDWILYTSSIDNYKEEFPSTSMSWDKADAFVTYHRMRHWEQKLMRAASPFLDDRLTYLNEAEAGAFQLPSDEKLLGAWRAYQVQGATNFSFGYAKEVRGDLSSRCTNAIEAGVAS